MAAYLAYNKKCAFLSNNPVAWIVTVCNNIYYSVAWLESSKDEYGENEQL